MITGVGNCVERLETLYIAGGNVKWDRRFGIYFWQFFRWLKQFYHMIQQFHPQVFILKRPGNIYIHTKLVNSSIHSRVIRNTQNVKQFMSLPTDACISKMCQTHSMKYYWSIKRKGVEIQAKTMTDLRIILLSEGTGTKDYTLSDLIY